MPGLQGGVYARGLRLVAAGVAALFFCGLPRPAAGADPYRDVSQSLGEGLLALFPAVEGYVVSASGAEVYVDLAQKDLLKPGMELQVYRPGAEMIHPVTRQVLGSYEKSLGVLSVTEVREKYSRGALDASGAAAGVVAGDRVRLSARRLRTLLHVAGTAAGIKVGPLAQSLIARGEQSGRFAMIDEPGWASSLDALAASWESVRADPALLRRLGETAAADLLLLARIESGAVSRVVIEVRSLRTGTLLGELSERWPTAVVAAGDAVSAEAPTVAAAAAATPAVVAAGPAPVPDEYIVRNLATPARALAAGDILGEGRLEVVLTNGSRLSLFRWEAESLAWRWDEDGRGGRRILSLDVADLDGDGRAEVLLTSFSRGRVVSELRRWQDNALRVVAAIEGVYLRAAPRAGAPSPLLGQRAGFEEVFAGRVERYRLLDGSFERIAGSELPRVTGLFGLALAPEGSSVALYTLDDAGYISAMTPAGKALWRSNKAFGGHPAPLSASELFGRSAFEEEGREEKMRAFQGRLLAEPTTAGVRLVVPRNFSDSLVTLPRQRSYGQGEVLIFDGPAESPEEIHRSRAFDGYVADLARADIDGDGRAEILFVVNSSAGVLRGERGKLVAWRPAEGR